MQTGKSYEIRPNARVDGRSRAELNTDHLRDDMKAYSLARRELMQTPCPLCQTKVELDHRNAGQTMRCVACGKSFVAPAELSQTGRRHSLTEFPLLAVVALNCVTGGLPSWRDSTPATLNLLPTW